jgi:ATP-dependent Clp protease ATP-binding subunit ClpA
LLLDELEKAHPDVFNLLLQVMDHGTLTDNNGRKADFRNIILVMTTNAGAEAGSRASIGFTEQNHASDSLKMVEKGFSPEFRNRLDAIIQFKPLDISIVGHVVDKFIFELESLLADKNVTLHLTPKARLWLAENGCDAKMGARPMARLIQESIKKPLANDLLFGELAHGGHVKISVKNNELAFTIESAVEMLLTD